MASDEQDIKGARKNASELQSRFDCVDDWNVGAEMGFRVLPVSGQFLRYYDLDEFVFIVKVMLPADIKLMLYDGLCIRPSLSMCDEYFMVFASGKWPVLPEGAEIPKLRMLALGEACGDVPQTSHVVSVSNGAEFRLVFNKRTHTMAIPKEEETDEQCVVVVTPKE